MLCFLDRTFCSSSNCTGKCGRQWTKELQERANKWWGGPGAPVAFSDFCSTSSKEEKEECCHAKVDHNGECLKWRMFKL